VFELVGLHDFRVLVPIFFTFCLLGFCHYINMAQFCLFDSIYDEGSSQTEKELSGFAAKMN